MARTTAMKSSLGRSRRSTNRRKARDKVSLLDNADPPPSPSVWGVDEGVGLYPTIGRPESFEAMSQVMSQANDPAITFPSPQQDTRVPLENRFLPQHEPRRGQTLEDVVGTSALQFVPAYEEATNTSFISIPSDPPVRTASSSPPPPTRSSPKMTFRNSPTAQLEEKDAAWDAVIEADDNSLKGRSCVRNKSSNRSLDDSLGDSSLEERKSVNSFFRRKPKKYGSSSVPTTVETKSKPVKSLDDSASEISASVVSGASRKGPRIARLAALFSKGGNKKDTITEEKKVEQTRPTSSKKSKSNPVPPSPSQSHVSSSSSGYVGWPGTQDKRGKTVVESSYDDSSVGPSAFNRRKYANDLEQAADLEKFMNDPYEDDSLTEGSPRKLTPLERRVEHIGRDEPDENGSLEGNPADFHLAAVLADASVSSPIAKKSLLGLDSDHEVPRYSRARSTAASSTVGSRPGAPSSIGGASASTGISIHNLFPSSTSNSGKPTLPAFKGDPWDIDSSQPTSSPGTSVSKDSSAYFMTRGGENAAVLDPSTRYGLRSNPRGIAAVIRRKNSGGLHRIDSEGMAPTEEAIAAKSRMETAPRAFNAMNVKGYPGFINKTRDVPNLIDAVDSDSVASSRATSMYSASLNPHSRGVLPGFTGGPRIRRKDVEDDSDVFDGLSNIGETLGATAYTPTKTGQTQMKNNVVLLGGGLSTIQTTPEDFDNRKTPSEFDQSLTNSDVDQYGFAKTPGFNEMLNAGIALNESANMLEGKESDSEVDRPRSSIMVPRGRGTETAFAAETESEVSALQSVAASFYGRRFRNDLTVYRVHSSLGKKLVRTYRKLCRSADPDDTVEDLERDEDAKKAFALSEMRSRIMEKDIERRLERQGGTIPVDDLVLTPYHQAMYRVRDAVIVSKAWRDGASPKDVVNASRMTRRPEQTYYVKRPVRRSARRSPNSSMSRSPNNSMMNESASFSSDHWYSIARAYTLEPIEWLDDTDFMQIRCPSLGPRSMRGFEMFTIGDCQSILLKLTNEKCMILRDELNAATAKQIDAEEMMRDEGDAGEDMMTDAEMTYLAAMEDVKNLSMQLVVAERAFNLVRERIEKLVARYEELLVRIENESIATASVITYEEDESYYSDEYSDYSSGEDYEKELFQRRAQRAELRAELAAREALMARQEARKIQAEKQREIEALQQRLAELQSESSHAITDRDHSLQLAKAIAANAPLGQQSPKPPAANNTEKINGVKQKFRDRTANRKSGSVTFGSDVGTGPKLRRPGPNIRSLQRRLVGEEMFQHLDFYERSLKAVEPNQ